MVLGSGAKKHLSRIHMLGHFDSGDGIDWPKTLLWLPAPRAGWRWAGAWCRGGGRSEVRTTNSSNGSSGGGAPCSSQVKPVRRSRVRSTSLHIDCGVRVTVAAAAAFGSAGAHAPGRKGIHLLSDERNMYSHPYLKKTTTSTRGADRTRVRKHQAGLHMARDAPTCNIGPCPSPRQPVSRCAHRLARILFTLRKAK